LQILNIPNAVTTPLFNVWLSSKTIFTLTVCYVWQTCRLTITWGMGKEKRRQKEYNFHMLMYLNSHLSALKDVSCFVNFS